MKELPATGINVSTLQTVTGVAIVLIVIGVMLFAGYLTKLYYDRKDKKR